MLLVAVLGVLFGFCLLVMKLQYSVALGAFLVGAIMAESRQLHRIERLVEPIRDMFSAIFFVAIGLLFDPNVLVKYWLPITVITWPWCSANSSAAAWAPSWPGRAAARPCAWAWAWRRSASSPSSSPHWARA
jgi:Kef-type K+ transport system membrane component KefB